MKYKEIIKIKSDELLKKIITEKNNIKIYIINNRISKPSFKNPLQIRNLRKLIARYMTAINSKRIKNY